MNIFFSRLNVDLFASLSLLVAIAGCGLDTDAKAIVTGTVTYAGEAIGDGDISFIPKTGTKGAGGGGRILKGTYTVDVRGGLPLGDYLVRVEGFQLKPGQEPPPAVMMPGQRGPQFLPDKYHLKSNLEFSVTETGVIEKNFDLEK